MTDHLAAARSYMSPQHGPRNLDLAQANALIDIAESLRTLVKQGEPIAAEPAPIKVPNLAHPACRSARWRDNHGDEWRFMDGEWRWRAGAYGNHWYSRDESPRLDPATGICGPFTRIID